MGEHTQIKCGGAHLCRGSGMEYRVCPGEVRIECLARLLHHKCGLSTIRVSFAQTLVGQGIDITEKYVYFAEGCTYNKVKMIATRKNHD